MLSFNKCLNLLFDPVAPRVAKEAVAHSLVFQVLGLKPREQTKKTELHETNHPA